MSNNLSHISKSQRFVVMDVLKGLAIFLVLWGHCIQQTLSTNYYDEPVFRWIYSFHMPLFMVISGFFAVNVLRRDFRHLLLNKGRQLILPLIVWCVLFDVFEGFAGISRPLTGKIIEMFWFLKSLFICFLLFYAGFSYRNPKAQLIGGGITLIISQLINYSQVSFMYPCFLAGYFLRENLEYFRRHIWRTCLVSIVIYAVTSCVCEYCYAKGIYIDLFTGANYNAAYMTVKLIRGISASTALISGLWMLLDNANIAGYLRPINALGGMTLAVYILQTFILENWLGPRLNFDTYSFFEFNFLIAPLLSLAVALLCVLLTRLIRLNPYTSLLLLGESRPLVNVNKAKGQPDTDKNR